MARIALPMPDRSDNHIGAAFEIFDEEGREPIALYYYLSAAPEMLRGFAEFSRALRYEGSTSRALRELVILRVAQLADCSYEWLHHIPMASAAGIADEKVTHLERWRDGDAFSATERAALRCAEEIVGAGLSDDGFAELKDSFGDKEIVELVLLITHYAAVARILDSLKIEVEPRYQVTTLPDAVVDGQRIPE